MCCPTLWIESKINGFMTKVLTFYHVFLAIFHLAFLCSIHLLRWVQYILVVLFFVDLWYRSLHCCRESSITEAGETNENGEDGSNENGGGLSGVPHLDKYCCCLLMISLAQDKQTPLNSGIIMS